MLSPSQRQLLPYAIVVLFGYIGFSLPLPVLPEMFLDPHLSILPASYTLEKKTMLLGFVIASYPLGQLFGCPLLGRLSDRYGRKKMIVISLCGTALGYLITAASASAHSVWGIFSGLLFCGFCEGNVAIAQAAIADTAPAESKTLHFGWINVFVTLGFIIGPLLGGQLANPEIASWFTFATPFWAASIMTLMGIAIILVGSKETFHRSTETVENFFKTQWKIFRKWDLSCLLTANFFLALAFTAFWRFLPVFLEREFNFNSSWLAYVMVYDAIAYGLALILIVKPMAKRFSSKGSFVISTVFFAVFMSVVPLPHSAYGLWLTIPPIGFGLSVAMTNGSVMVSDAADRSIQGQAMGTLQSVQVFAEVITGIGGGFLAGALPSLPLFVGSGMALIGAIILFASIRDFKDIFSQSK